MASVRIWGDIFAEIDEGAGAHPVANIEDVATESLFGGVPEGEMANLELDRENPVGRHARHHSPDPFPGCIGM